MDQAINRIGGYVAGILTTATIAGASALLFFAILGLFGVGIPFAVPLAVFAALAGLIPAVGAYIGAAPAVMVGFFQSGLTGILILVEGPYYRGDWIRVPGPAGLVEGEVEEIGLRRTVLRDRTGIVHAVGNGLIRQSSNLTRVFSVAGAEVQILRTQGLDRAIVLASRIGREIQVDPDWADHVVEGPVETWVTALTVDGAIVHVQIRVLPNALWPLTGELRQRLATALAAESIGVGRWDIPVPTEPPPPDEAVPEVDRRPVSR